MGGTGGGRGDAGAAGATRHPARGAPNDLRTPRAPSPRRPRAGGTGMGRMCPCGAHRRSRTVARAPTDGAFRRAGVGA